MVAIVVVIFLLALYYWLDTPRRNMKAQEIADSKKRYKIKNPEHRISYKELAHQFRDLKTARNMIELGLVKKSGDPDDKYIKLIYEEYFTDENNCRDNYRARNIGNTFQLFPSCPGFVGNYPKDPNRRFTA